MPRRLSCAVNWRSCKNVLRFSLLGLFLLFANVASAHKPSDTFLRIKIDQDLTIRWDIALRDLEVVVGLDADQDGNITWGEVRGREELIRELAKTQLKLAIDDDPTPLKFDHIEVANHSDGAYAALLMQVDRPGRFSKLTIDYGFLFDIDPTHRGLVSYQGRGGDGAYVISSDDPQLIIQDSGNGWLMPLLNYIVVGVWHICIGFDHILFLVALLLPSVWFVERRSGKKARYVPHEHWKTAMREVLKVVTYFTISHSLTLWLVVSKTVELPSRAVETIIALSIVVTAMLNVYAKSAKNGRWVAFGFGLVHGSGFGGVLTDLGLPTSMLLIALLGFNIGVELGQIIIVAVLFPILFRYRKTVFYRRYVFRWACYAIATLGVLWMIERWFGLTILGS